MKIIWTGPALREIEALGEHIARENPAAAARTVTRIFEQVDVLETQPHIGRPGRIAGTRELVISRTPYIVPYRVGALGIEVLSVIHGARRWPNRFD
jgi:toxin ParE1/3/4